MLRAPGTHACASGTTGYFESAGGTRPRDLFEYNVALSNNQRLSRSNARDEESSNSMQRLTRITPVRARIILSLALGLLCAFACGAPFLWRFFPIAAALDHLFFSPLCHQIPERSFTVAGFAFAVCHRCTGIYIGLFAGSLLPESLIDHFVRSRRPWIVAASLLLLLDVLAPIAGLWPNTPATRSSTGLLFGLVVAALTARGITEFLAGSAEDRCGRFSRPTPISMENLS